jgi:nucleotide-binding universal stress UspA family protein
MKMTMKTLLAILDNSKHVPGVVSVAADLAQRFESHLVGLYAVHAEAQAHALQDEWMALKMESYAKKLGEQAQRSEAAFQQYAKAVLGSSAEFRRADQDSLGAVSVQARYADLVVMGQRDSEEAGTGVPSSIVERAVLAVGRPVLVVPYFSNAYPDLGRNVLVAWSGTRESVRAVCDALPLLQRARNVVVMAVNPTASKRDHGEIPGADLALYLARHGVKAEARPGVALEIGVGDELLARASDMGSDLLVMGAYGHSRLQELVMGGVTQTIMQHMTLPVLMSH